MLPLPGYLRLTRASTLYDIIVVAPFAAPSLMLGRFGATTRLVFSVWLAWAMLQDPLPVLWLFLVPELLWGVVQWWPIGSSTPRAAFTSAAPMRSSRGG